MPIYKHAMQPIETGCDHSALDTVKLTEWTTSLLMMADVKIAVRIKSYLCTTLHNVFAVPRHRVHAADLLAVGMPEMALVAT